MEENITYRGRGNRQRPVVKRQPTIVLELTGILDVDIDYPNHGPLIDKTPLVDVIWDKFPSGVGDVVVTIGKHTAQGPLNIEEGDPGYSEMTDWILDKISIGDLDLFDLLVNSNEFDTGDRITIRIDNGPAVNAEWLAQEKERLRQQLAAGPSSTNQSSSLQDALLRKRQTS